MGLFFLLLRFLEGLDKDNLGDALDELETFVDDAPAPEEPAAVVVDPCGKRDGCLVAVKGDLHVPAGIEADKSLELLEGLGCLLFDLVGVGKGCTGKGGIEVDNDLGADDIDNGSLALFAKLDLHAADRLLLELVLGEGLDTLGVALTKCLLRRDGNRAFGTDFLADKFLIKTDNDMFLADTDGYRAIDGIRAVDTGLLGLILMRGIKNIVTDFAGIAQSDKISFFYCHDSPDYIKS